MGKVTNQYSEKIKSKWNQFFPSKSTDLRQSQLKYQQLVFRGYWQTDSKIYVVKQKTRLASIKTIKLEEWWTQLQALVQIHSKQYTVVLEERIDE